MLVKAMIDGDRRVSVCELESSAGVSRGTIDIILNERLKMNKVCARWLLRILTEEVRINRVAASSNFLNRANRGGDSCLDRIVTTDESMFNLFDPKTKMESSVSKRTSSPPPLKARVNKSAHQVMLIFFMTRKEILLVLEVPQG